MYKDLFLLDPDSILSFEKKFPTKSKSLCGSIRSSDLTDFNYVGGFLEYVFKKDIFHVILENISPVGRPLDL